MNSKVKYTQSILGKICLNTRGNGNSRFILKAAILNPNVVIVGGYEHQVKLLEKEYYEMLQEVSFLQKLAWGFVERKHPIFMSCFDNFQNIGLPVVFDNSAVMCVRSQVFKYNDELILN